jgi:NADPH:quinone reductase-like Zn-dependent oxidoreductase
MKMKAIVYEEYGPPEVLHIEEVEKPNPKEREVLIKVHVTTVSAADWRLRKAEPFIARFFNGLLRPKRSKILGIEISGVIESIGNAVSKFKVGDEVFACTELDFGAYAEYACLPENGVIALKPQNLSFEEAAAIPYGGLGAFHYFKNKMDMNDKQVLINGASGSVGTYAVQLAKYYGAQVTGVCSSGNIALVKSIGAHKVIDYTKQDFTNGENLYDFIFDAVGKTSKAKCKNILAPNGSFATIMKGGGSKKERAQDLLVLKKMIEEGKIKPVIDKEYNMDEIVAAHAYVERGYKKGNVIVKIKATN